MKKRRTIEIFIHQTKSCMASLLDCLLSCPADGVRSREQRQQRQQLQQLLGGREEGRPAVDPSTWMVSCQWTATGWQCSLASSVVVVLSVI